MREVGMVRSGGEFYEYDLVWERGDPYGIWGGNVVKLVVFRENSKLYLYDRGWYEYADNEADERALAEIIRPFG